MVGSILVVNDHVIDLSKLVHITPVACNYPELEGEEDCGVTLYYNIHAKVDIGYNDTDEATRRNMEHLRDMILTRWVKYKEEEAKCPP